MKPSASVEQITNGWVAKFSNPADKDEVRQLARIAEWQALATHDGVRPLPNYLNSKVRWAISNGMRDILQLRKTGRPARLDHYCTLTDQVNP